MAKWQELGEVPDSDDESAWDTQESLSHEPGAPSTSAADDTNDATHVENPVEIESQDVWAIPFSPKASVEERDVIHSQKTQEHEPSVPAPASPISESILGSTLSTPVDLGHIIRNGSPVGDLSSQDRARSEDPRPVSRPEISGHSIPPAIVIPEDSVAEETDQARDGRSWPVRTLRPRKPIQEHPYLLESVQYSKTWKSHGLRPVRVVTEEGKRRQEEDSQEQEFEDDSQNTSKDPGQEETEESQVTINSEALSEIDGISPALSPIPTPESHPARPRRVLHASQDDDDEFPDPNDILKWNLKQNATRRVHKRQASPKLPSAVKRSRNDASVRVTKDAPTRFDVDDLFDIPTSPPQASPDVLTVLPAAAVNRSRPRTPATLNPDSSSNAPWQIDSPKPPGRRREIIIDLTAPVDQGSNENESDENNAHTASEDEMDQMRRVAKRLRGVLPASWLRLDQQAPMQQTKPMARQRSPDASTPERSLRKGVAQRRLLPAQESNAAAVFHIEDSDDSDSTIRQQELPDPPLTVDNPSFEDGAVSVIEEDHIDDMVSRGKRSSTGLNGYQRNRKRKQSMFDGQPDQRKRQQRITGLLIHKNSVSSEAKRSQVSKHSKGRERLDTRNTARSTLSRRQPPHLSILDVMEPDAPDFIRIAARTVRRRRDQGRSSPSRKAIMLGTRQDTIDAVSVLRRWNEGMMRPRASASLSSYPERLRGRSVTTLTQTRLVQAPTGLNNQSSTVKTLLRPYQPRRIVKQTNLDGFVDVAPRDESDRGLPANSSGARRPKPQVSAFRPAQLEMFGGTNTNRHTFDARKRALDAIYRRSRKSLPSSRNLLLEQSISSQAPAQHQQPTLGRPRSPQRNGAAKPLGIKRRATRKQTRPQFVDVFAPQHAHANDPLPLELSSPTVILDEPQNEEAGKLLCLAPYGTHYTQHFEVFPLDRGVFFHESTIIGRARLRRALDDIALSSLSSHRGQCTFTIDEQTLTWGPWDSKVSSEVGIIFDWVMDRLCTSAAYPDIGTSSSVEAAEFVLVYLQDHLTFIETESSSLFAIRILDILQGFERRLQEILNDSRCVVRSLIEVLTRVLLIAMQSLRLFQKLDNFSEAFQLEEVLKRLASATAKVLLRTGLQDVRGTYAHLQQMSSREKGIQNDEFSIICWVVLIRILEEARLPRAGFWEVASSSICPSADGTYDATVLEQAWRALFTLLPLGEFDNTGVVIAGLRHTAPVEGWILPQRLLQRVFGLYRSNSRQAAGFNDYLRAAVSRCHYLVEQWGWQKPNAILGAIFDFFAAQDLHNLRNEEVYQSPQFLEELSGSPSLAVTLEDRCFHIYLKLIAISIQRLRKLGMMKEMKNLVARLLPNHSRQYDKVMETHEAEIAALRNHHDLLCTLFWVAPPDMRPSVQSIEGLVALRNSHKEACLISLRTWSRLSRFVVSSCEDISAYKPLAEWQRNISQQVLDQFLSVESEIDQQLQGMSAEASKNITQEHKEAVINKNKKVALDLLHFSMRAFLDVMHYTRTLGATSFVLNTYSLEQITSRLSFPSVKSDWRIFRVILDILDYYLGQISDYTGAEPLRSQDHEDAIMLLEHKYALHVMSLVRGVVSVPSPNVGIAQVRDRNICIEYAVTLAARLGACLIGARLLRLRQFFQVGKYNLFQDISKHTTSPARKYVPLFLATMIDRGAIDFKDLGLTPLDVFLAELVKPSKYLAYENRLATGLKRLGEAYLESAVIKDGDVPDYSSNRDLFDYTIVSMRKALRRAEGSQKANLQNMFSKALRSVMDRMKADLKSMVLNSTEHLNYIQFVRSIISLIRSQDLCAVDSFFYQISQEYSPSREDPRLQTAGILSWGNRLEEGDSKAASGLFYLLFPSFKIALTNGELGNEWKILKESMQHVHVFNFMLHTMLPAIVGTATQVSEGWILLDTYVESIDAQLSSACIHRQIGNGLADLLALHRSVLAGIGRLKTRVSQGLGDEHIVSLTAVFKILNILSPSVTTHFINEPESPVVSDMTETIDRITEFTSAADSYLRDYLHRENRQMSTFDHSRLFTGMWSPSSQMALRCDELIEKFSNHMVQDIRNNWVANGTTITVKGPSRPPKPTATQSGQGTRLPNWDKDALLSNLSEELMTWNYDHDVRTRRATDRALLVDFFF